MLLLSRLIAALAYAGAAFLFGMLLGERGELGIVQSVFTTVIPVATLVLTVVSSGRIWVFLTGLAMLLGLLLGQRQFANAWSECLTEAERVRGAILRHAEQHGDYPAGLRDLEMSLPCRCGFRRTILHYFANERGFRIWFTNDRETWAGTHRRSVTATGRSSGPPPR